MPSELSYVALNCTLKRSPAESSTDLLLDQIAGLLRAEGASGKTVRVVDHDVLPGVTSDEGEADDWPSMREQILAADLFVLGTPIWLGHPSSVCQRALERLDAFLGETDERDRMVSYDRVAMVAVVGNEDGAHHVGAEVFQALNDVGFTLAAGAETYWVGEAMQKTDYRDLDAVPEKVSQTMQTMVRNAVHLARLLKASPYPAEVHR